MEELIARVSEKTGLPAETAKTAVETVIGFLKERLPESIAGQLDGYLANEEMMGKATDIVGDIAGKLGGLFGGGES